jgi:predicted metalloprotease with PDZ domain
VRVDDVISGSPAANAGIVVGDHILAMDGQEVRTPEELVAMVAELRPGYDTEVTILRDAEIIPVHVVIGSNFTGPRQQGSLPPRGRSVNDRRALQEHLTKLKEEQRALEDRLRTLPESTDSLAGERR